ncbi:MAP kinase-activating death domain protein [Fasciola hepatica]|uniref:MAP kinase-activating death domain protein n=1 Tax=Fasciola hepatica TaxID=6192 RepID=A0A4E0RFF6_FASHE|nr:MAP kinase-activating death domain protein [Fasciola hepatica]
MIIPIPDATDQSAELERALSKRLSDETYLIQVARAIKAGNTPSIFSRGRLCSMLEYEEYRNLLLARLNLSRANTAVGTISSVQQSSLMIDVPVESWSQYKALVWILRQITQGLDVSLRSDVFIPTPTNVHSEAYMTSRNRSTPVNEESARGGLASAFVLLEIAHTHYYQLPSRNERGFFTFGRASLGSLDSGKLRSSESRPVSPVTTEEGQDSNRGPENNQLSVNQENNVTNTTCSDGESLTPGLSEPKLDPRIRTSSLNSNPTVRASLSSGAQKRILASRPPVPRRSRGSSSHSQCPEVHESSDSNTVFEVPSEPSSMRSLTPEPYSSMRVPLFDESDDSGLTTNKSSQSHGYRYHRSRLLTPDTTIPDDMRSLPFNLRYRRSLGEVHYLHPSSSSPGINARGVDGRVKVGRTFVFEDLTNGNQTKSGVWNNLQFWEDAFLDAVAQERDMLGMDFRPGDLLARYNSASPLKRKHAELEEDRLLAGLMHNLIAFMVMMGVERTDIRRKIRRLLAKSHMGLHYSQEISNLLDVLDFLYGNDVDLKTLQSRATSHRAYEVYRGTDKSGELLFIEVGCECLLIRNLAGFILDRWWYDQMINVTYRKPKNILSVSIQINQKPTSHLFYTSKGEVLYLAIQKAMEQVSIDSRRGPLGGDLNGELNVINLENGSSGVIKITPDGFYMKFNQKEMFVRISHVKRCSAPQHDIFTIEYFDATEKCLLVRNLRTDMAAHLIQRFHLMVSKAKAILAESKLQDSSNQCADSAFQLYATEAANSQSPAIRSLMISSRNQ